MQAIRRERRIFHSQLGAYMISLLLSNLLSSISLLINATWIAKGGITTGACYTNVSVYSNLSMWVAIDRWPMHVPRYRNHS